MMNNVVSGAHYFFSGFYLITRPGLKRFVVIPLLINILLFVSLFFMLRHFMAEFNTWFSAYLPTWLQWLSWVLWLLFAGSFLLIFIFTFVMVANIIAAPFNSLLAEKVEWYLTGKTLVSRSLFENIKDVPHILGRQLSVILYYLPRALLCLILFFIPIVHVIVAIVWFLFNGWFMALTYFDYPTDNHRVSFKDLRAWLDARRWLGLGFGVSVLIVTMVPGLNFFVIPAAVAGATKCWVEE